MTGQEKHDYLLSQGWFPNPLNYPEAWSKPGGGNFLLGEAFEIAWAGAMTPYPEYDGDVALMRSFQDRQLIDLGNGLARQPDVTWRDASAISRLILHMIDSK